MAWQNKTELTANSARDARERAENLSAYVEAADVLMACYDARQLRPKHARWLRSNPRGSASRIVVDRGVAPQLVDSWAKLATVSPSSDLEPR